MSTDPAIGAAQRAWAAGAVPWDKGGSEEAAAVAAAREALDPIRALHRPTCELGGDKCPHLPGCTLSVCANCGDDWPCVTALVCYSSEEL